MARNGTWRDRRQTLAALKTTLDHQQYAWQPERATPCGSSGPVGAGRSAQTA